MKRKNRVVVEITTSKPVLQKDAKDIVERLLNQQDESEIRILHAGVKIDKLTCKKFTNVMLAEKRKMK